MGGRGRDEAPKLMHSSGSALLLVGRPEAEGERGASTPWPLVEQLLNLLRALSRRPSISRLFLVLNSQGGSSGGWLVGSTF